MTILVTALKKKEGEAHELKLINGLVFFGKVKNSCVEKFFYGVKWF